MKISTILAIAVFGIAYFNYPEQTTQAVSHGYQLIVALLGAGLTKFLALKFVGV